MLMGVQHSLPANLRRPFRILEFQRDNKRK